MILRKSIVWSIVAILLFSSLSFTFSIKLLKEQERETKIQAFISDDESVLYKQPELQNSYENTENLEPQLHDDFLLESDKEPDFQNFNESTENVEPRLPTVNMEKSFQQNSTMIPEKKIQIPREFEVPALDRGEILTEGVAVYSDRNLTVLSSINWGNLEPGGNTSIVCYIKNTAQIISKLTLDTANWAPSEASNFITLTWDYDGQILDIDEIILVALTLNISNNIQGITEFFFDIIIIGSGV